MRISFRDVVVALTTAVVVAGMSLSVSHLAGQAQAPDQVPRMPDGKPSLNGIWEANNTASYDLEGHAARRAIAVLKERDGKEVPAPPVLALGAWGGIPAGLSVVEGNQIPYLPAAVAKKIENFANSLTQDPASKCYLPGVPRATYMPFPFQILQGTHTIVMAYEFASASRTIYIDKAAPAPNDFWMGYSVGRWEGDTLVVDVTNLNEDTWFDRAGNYHSDALHVVERYTRVDRDHLNYEATIEDQKVFSRPWKIIMPLYRRTEKQARILEYKCVEFVEELMLGHLRQEQVAKHWQADLGEFGGTLIIDVTRKAK
jgi:hypothetical protein